MVGVMLKVSPETRDIINTLKGSETVNDYLGLILDGILDGHPPAQKNLSEMLTVGDIKLAVDSLRKSFEKQLETMSKEIETLSKQTWKGYLDSEKHGMELMVTSAMTLDYLDQSVVPGIKETVLTQAKAKSGNIWDEYRRKNGW